MLLFLLLLTYLYNSRRLHATFFLSRMAPKVNKRIVFEGQDELTLEQWRELEVASSEDAPRRFLKSWQGALMGHLTARLTNDNRRIDRLTFSLAGTIWNEGFTAQASSFWEDAEGISFSLPHLDMKIFSFSEGTMYSDLVDSSKLDLTWYRDGVEEDSVLISEDGVPGFTLRCFVVPNASPQPLWAAIQIALYPIPKETLLESFPICLNPSFPGYKLFAANNFYIGFLTESIFPDFKGSLPIMPCVISGDDWEEVEAHPPTEDLRRAMAHTLRAVAKPEIRRGVKSMKKSLEDLLAAGEQGLKAQPVDTIWPLPSNPSKTTQGKSKTSPPRAFCLPSQCKPFAGSIAL